MIDPNWNPHQNKQTTPTPQQQQMPPMESYLKPQEQSPDLAPSENNVATFLLDQKSLSILEKCDKVYTNTIINLGIQMVQESIFFNRFLTEENMEELTKTAPFEASIEKQSIQQTQPESIQPTQSAQSVENNQNNQNNQNLPPVIDALDFSNI